jgi:hypothetical protein
MHTSRLKVSLLDQDDASPPQAAVIMLLLHLLLKSPLAVANCRTACAECSFYLPGESAAALLGRKSQPSSEMTGDQLGDEEKARWKIAFRRSRSSQIAWLRYRHLMLAPP